MLLIGDLTEISNPNEGQSQTNGSSPRHEKCIRFISYNILIDFCFQGNRFTLYKNRCFCQIMDRTLVNPMWFNIYPDANLMHLPIIDSDHAPILLNTYLSLGNCNQKSFKFEAKWLLYDDLFNIIRDVWALFIKGFLTYQ